MTTCLATFRVLGGKYLDLLVLGTFMDMSPLIVITTPILLPVVMEVGVDPIHFGIIMMLNLGIGLVTPPVGSVLFAGTLAMRFDAPVYDAEDAADALPARPDAAALVYPVATMTRPFAHEGSRLCLIGGDPAPETVAFWSLETMVRADMPPVFLMHAADDPAVPVENALILYDALRARDCAVAMHLFEAGGHGFGLRGIAGTPLAAWPDLIAGWGRAKGIFPGMAT